MRLLISMKIIILIVFITMVNITNAQNQDTIHNQVELRGSVDTTLLPLPYFNNEGVMVGVLFSLQQAQKIENDYTMYQLMDSIIKVYGVSDSLIIGIIDNQSKKIALLETKTINKNKLLLNRKELIVNKNAIIVKLKNTLKNQDVEIVLYEGIIESHVSEKKILKKNINRQKRQKVFSFIITGVVSVIAIISLI